MPTLTIYLSNTRILSGDARTEMYNSIAQVLDALGPQWTHRITKMTQDRLHIDFVLAKPEIRV